ncbi:hypothetical protein RFI_39653, partial [Reticulomyxa filosa]
KKKIKLKKKMEGNSIYGLRTLLNGTADSLIAGMVCYLAVNVTRTFFRNQIKQDLPDRINRIWYIYAGMIVISTTACGIVSFGFHVYIFWMVYLDIRQMVATIACFMFAYTYYVIERERQVLHFFFKFFF